MVNGELADISQVPHLVSIKSEEFGVCGGAIISKWHVLTAAHCVGGDITRIEIRAGSTLRGEGGTVHHAKAVKRHKKFFVDEFELTSSHDIAVIRVKVPFTFIAHIQPIRLFGYGEKIIPNMRGLESGWGQNEDGLYDKHLRKLSLLVVNKTECNKIYENWGGLKIGQFCAKNEDYSKFPCYGDSGNPLVIDGRLAGIDIYGGSCELPDTPSVYTEIPSFRYWIDRVVFNLTPGLHYDLK